MRNEHDPTHKLDDLHAVSRALVPSYTRAAAMRAYSLLLLLSAWLVGCGPDKRPEEPCDGPSFNLVVTAEGGPLPDDTRINVRYGSNQKGEAYALGQQSVGQAVFCEEQASNAAGEAGSANEGAEGVQALSCRLYTQGPARLDATATGYQTLKNEPLSFDKAYCQVEIDVKLKRELPDAGE